MRIKLSNFREYFNQLPLESEINPKIVRYLNMPRLPRFLKIQFPLMPLVVTALSLIQLPSKNKRSHSNLRPEIHLSDSVTLKGTRGCISRKI